MNKKAKYAMAVVGVILGATVLSSCNSFCSSEDLTHYLYAYDPLNTTYFDTEADAEDFLLQSFKSQSKYDLTRDADLGLSSIKKYNIESKAYTINAEDAIGRYGNLYYVIPGDYVMSHGSSETTTTTVDGVEETTNNDLNLTLGINSFMTSLISSAKSSGIAIPSYKFIERLDQLTLETMISNIPTVYSQDEFRVNVDYTYVTSLNRNNITYEDLYGYTYEEYTLFDNGNGTLADKKETLLGNIDGTTRTALDGSGKTIYVKGRNYSVSNLTGYTKFYDETDATAYTSQLKIYNSLLVKEIGTDQCMSENFIALYLKTLTNKVSQVKTCITQAQGFYGNIGDDVLNKTISMTGKGTNFWTGWGDAFSKHGFLEGLLVYPISALVDTLSHSFGMNGWGQLWAILLVTFIVRILFMGITLPSTISTQKQQFLQPELAKLQQKYPNSNTNDYEKQRLAQAQMALYKKHNVHPFLSILTMFVQFPLFICVWNALQGSAVLTSDSVLGLNLSDTIWNVLSNFTGWPGNGGWWTALVLILLMSGGQILAMLIPQWLTKRRKDKITKLGKNPAEDKNVKTMKIVQWAMIIFTIILGFQLPSAMGVYWLAGALFNIAQSLIMDLIFRKKGV